MHFDSQSTGPDVFSLINEQRMRSAIAYATGTPLEPRSFDRALATIGVNIEFRDLGAAILDGRREPPFRLSNARLTSSTYSQPKLAEIRKEVSAAHTAIDRWSALSDGWDEEDSPAPLHSQLEASRKLLNQANEWAIPSPTPYIAGDGEFGFRWRKGEGFASASFLPSGEILMFARAPGSRDPFREQANVDEQISWLSFVQQLLAFT